MSTAFRFLSTRLKAFTGYMDVPTTYDAMEFYLPPFSVRAHRVVHIRDRLWELWSPNATQHAYYPGVRDETTFTETDVSTELRRQDGHLGRFDHTVSAQYFDPRRPWLGFIRKWTRDKRPENILFRTVWMPSNAPTRGTFRLSFVKDLRSRIFKLINAMNSCSRVASSHSHIWENRPLRLTKLSMDRFSIELTVDDATDLLTSTQRDIKELSAWNRMVDIILRNLTSADPTGELPTADENLIGVWLNGCDKTNGLWLLYNRVPCYIVHEGDGYEDRRRLETAPLRCVTMITHTFLMTYEEEVKNQEKRLVANGQLLGTRDEDYGLGKYTDIRSSTWEKRYWSTPKGQGYDGRNYYDPRLLETPKSFHPTPAYTEVDGKMIPPAVVQCDADGSWSHWFQDVDGNEIECMRKRSSTFDKHDCRHTYFDRKLKRVLHLEESLDIPRHYDATPEIFGLPAPSWTYVESPDDRRVMSRSLSQWCYSSMHPLKSERGLQYAQIALAAPPPAGIYDSDSEVSLGGDSDDGYFLPVSSRRDQGSKVDKATTLVDAASASAPVVKESKGKEVNQRPLPSYLPKSPSASSSNDGRYVPRSSLRSLSPRRRPYSPRRSRSRRRSRSPRRSPSRRRSRSGGRFISRATRRSRSPLPRSFRRSRSPRRPNSYSTHDGSRFEPRPNYWAERARSPRDCSNRSSFGGSSSLMKDIKRNSRSPTRYNSARSVPVHRQVSTSKIVSRAPSVSPTLPLSLPDGARETSPGSIKSADPYSHNIDVAHTQDESCRLPSLVTALPSAPIASSSGSQKPSLLERLGGQTSSSTSNSSPSSSSLVAPKEGPSERMLELFAGATEAPDCVKPDIEPEGQSRFLIIWNLPIIFCWDDVLTWIFQVLSFAYGAKIRRIHRTNERGFQVFWLAFNTEEKASGFRGIVTYRRANLGHVVKCDFVAPEEYSAVAGRCRDVWEEGKGYLGSLISSAPFPEEPLSNRLTHPRLASRLGIDPDPPLTHVPTRRSRRRGRKTRLPTDGGAL